ncbi:putative deoxyribonuclease II family protein [Blattamonas nauphoetae]|uniref:Deoxyribonuclease II family protein n=1 Tax=Blattamonas nauphoetae TaxID=2049346 RepID=A0ABQ9XRB3_9EUKA|nr:putative deoxyribonuclease II family protein [Blattamonas nauphoetae]
MLLPALITIFSSLFALPCRSPTGASVEWFIMLKSPTVAHSNPFLKNGSSYTYIDATSKVVKFLSKDITAKNSPLALTLAPLYNNQAETSFMYNDDTPDGKTGQSYGHTKGVIGQAANEGFWLVHSVPQFPPVPSSGYSFNAKSLTYGQSYMCMTLDNTNLNKVGMHQQRNHPQIYHHSISARAAAAMPNLAAAMNGTFLSRTPSAASETIKGTKSTPFMVFSKNAPWGKDIQSALIQPTLKTGMIWETWMRPRNDPICDSVNKPPRDCLSAITLTAGCDGSTAEDVDWDEYAGKPSYQPPFFYPENMDSASSFTWRETDDHSKWGVTSTSNGTSVATCIGDVNRMTSQTKRGGGYVCTMDRGVHQSFSALITTHDKCTRSTSNSRGFVRSLLSKLF